MTDQRQETIDRLKREGGPAFARAAGPEGMCWANGDPGMSLRDYFAAATVTGLLSNANYSDSANVSRIAADAYRMADAMIQARKA